MIKHRAYLFDSQKYELSIKTVLEEFCRTNEINDVKRYIKNNSDKLKSPYTGEPLHIEDIEKIIYADVQEYMSYILTECYEPVCDIGLNYMWDAAAELLKQMPLNCEAGLCVSGEELKFFDMAVNPRKLNQGYHQPMADKNLKRTKYTEVEKVLSIYRTGIIGAEKAAVIYKNLKKNTPCLDSISFHYHKQKFQYYVKNKLPRLYMNRDIIYDITIEELLKAYNDLLNIYKQAEQMKKGLLIIFFEEKSIYQWMLMEN
jgi:hypothetical protein